MKIYDYTAKRLVKAAPEDIRQCAEALVKMAFGEGVALGVLIGLALAGFGFILWETFT